MILGLVCCSNICYNDEIESERKEREEFIQSNTVCKKISLKKEKRFPISLPSSKLFDKNTTNDGEVELAETVSLSDEEEQQQEQQFCIKIDTSNRRNEIKIFTKDEATNVNNKPKKTQGARIYEPIGLEPNDSSTSYTTLQSCSICFDEYKENDEICCSKNRGCKHVFHKKCIVQWLMRNDDCPLCRAPFLPIYR